MAKNIAEKTLFCVVDRKPIPLEREVRKAVTCSPECKVILNKKRRAQADQRKCRVCSKPSTPEQRQAFKKWARETGVAPKKGRPSIEKAASHS